MSVFECVVLRMMVYDAGKAVRDGSLNALCGWLVAIILFVTR